MKILAIRGRNLTSLAGEFAVDFESEPLADAGVFAITGPTGAGKSTLLDALSLALFHETPRLGNAVERGMDIPDVGDHALSPGDARNMLRRGCGDARTEVDFIGIDGKRWRARWEVNRAHGRPNGRLQQARATLTDLTDDRTIGDTVTETRALIREKLGLSYQQFCRSILLAQNEFAAFLKANSGERAELLEALTGTEIYRRISRLCHQRTNRERGKLEDIEKALAVEPPLDDDARADLEKHLTTAEQSLQAAEQAHQALRKERQWHERYEQLQEQTRRHRHALDEQIRALDARAEEREQVNRLEAIDPARPLYADVRRASTALEAHRGREATVTKAVETATARVGTAEQQEATARKQLEQAEADQSARATNIRKARELDQTLRTLSKHVQAQQETLTKHEPVLAESAEQLNTAHTERDTNQQTIEAWPNWLTAHPVFAPVTDQWRSLGKALEGAGEALRLAELAERQLQQVEQNATTARDTLSALEQVKAKQQASVQEARREFDAASDEENAFDPASLDQEQEQLTAQQALLERLDTLLAEHRKLCEHHEQQQTRKRQLEHSRDAQDRRLQELETAIPEARARRDQARQALQATHNIADQHTEVLRRQLIDGEPCPVCGSTSHPGHPQSSREIAEILEQLQEQAHQAEQRLGQLEREQTRLDTENRSARPQIDELRLQIEQIVRALNQCRDGIGTIASEFGLADTPDTLASATRTRRTALEKRRTDLQRQRQALAAARKKRRKTEQALRKAEQQLEHVEAELKRLEEESRPRLDAVRTAVEEARIRRKERDAKLHQLVELLALDAPPDEDALHELMQSWRQGDALRGCAEQASRNRTLLEQRVTEHRDRHAQELRRYNEVQTACRDLQEQLDKTRRQRRETLDAEDVDAFERLLGQTVADASEALKAAEKAHQQARESLVSAERDRQHWQDRHRELEQQAAKAHQALADWLHGHENPDRLGLERGDLAGLIALLEIPDEQWQPLREELRKAEEDILQTTAVLKEAERHLADWQAQRPSRRDRETVEQLLAESGENLETLRQHAADLRAERRTDDQRRQRAARELEKFRAQHAVFDQWEKLNELIGSADGSRFQRYAQQFTLDVLITYANAQLEMLAPRYRLQRGEGNLGILVIDDDMGGELRGVHSLSGGESFLVSLALALGLAELSSQRVRVESLFVDEGFGSLDADTLRVAMDALDRLQAQGRKVGVISHVQELSERIGVQIRVVPTSPGRSVVRIVA